MKQTYDIGDKVRIFFVDNQTLIGEVLNINEESIELRLGDEIENGLLKNTEFIFEFKEIFKIEDWYPPHENL